eukprot:TRINITY_DN3850_c0_g1_i7.p1 TRINITY_DN3850_c0_g1~~TRINITY_DN3850_c0_g1_i7.p1  ORF type:complete len:558 (+),score=79.48 TRINITY_DN3850_c0_g1_i7:684-2357(+)
MKKNEKKKFIEIIFRSDFERDPHGNRSKQNKVNINPTTNRKSGSNTTGYSTRNSTSTSPPTKSINTTASANAITATGDPDTPPFTTSTTNKSTTASSPVTPLAIPTSTTTTTTSATTSTITTAYTASNTTNSDLIDVMVRPPASSRTSSRKSNNKNITNSSNLYPDSSPNTNPNLFHNNKNKKLMKVEKMDDNDVDNLQSTEEPHKTNIFDSNTWSIDHHDVKSVRSQSNQASGSDYMDTLSNLNPSLTNTHASNPVSSTHAPTSSLNFTSSGHTTSTLTNGNLNSNLSGNLSDGNKNKIKHKKRTSKSRSFGEHAEAVESTEEAYRMSLDEVLNSSRSPLLGINLQDIINMTTWSLLPSSVKNNLFQYLPTTDRQNEYNLQIFFRDSNFCQNILFYQHLLSTGRLEDANRGSSREEDGGSVGENCGDEGRGVHLCSFEFRESLLWVRGETINRHSEEYQPFRYPESDSESEEEDKHEFIALLKTTYGHPSTRSRHDKSSLVNQLESSHLLSTAKQTGYGTSKRKQWYQRRVREDGTEKTLFPSVARKENRADRNCT